MADDATDTTNSTNSTATTETQAQAPASADAPEGAAAPADDSTVLGGGETEGAPPEAGEAADDKPVVPEEYDLKAPEGMSFDDEAFAVADPVFRKLGLSNDQAQELMPVAADFAKRAGAAAIAQHEIDKASAFTAMKREWLENAKGDAEIGGAKWDASTAAAAKALDALGFVKGSEFRKFLDESGMGNHPEMIRAFTRVGQRVSEDTFMRGDGAGAAKQSREEILYPNDAKKEGA